MITTTLTGIVLTAMPIGEYDKRLVILTKERGKITAFAKGARKPSSAFLACSQPFSFGDFTLYEGRTSYNVMSVEVLNYFGELRSDMEACYYGMYFLEFSDYFTRENEDSTRVLKLLYQSLRALTKGAITKKLIRRIFELRMLELNGWAPQVFECVKCNSETGLDYFQTEAGGIVCSTCRKQMNRVIPISGGTIYTLQYILTSSIEKLYTFTITNEIMNELDKCIEDYRKAYIDKKMKSLDLLEKLF